MKRVSQTLRWVMDGKSGVAAIIQTFFFQIIIQLTNFLTGPIINHALGPVGKGELGSILLWPQMLGSVFALGLGPALLYNLKNSETPEERTELYSTALIMGLGFGLLAAGLGFVLIPVFLKQYSAQTILVARLFVLTAPINLLTLLVLNAYKARNLFRVVNQTNYAAPAITLGLVGSLSFLQALNPLTASLARKGPFVGIFLWKFWDLWKFYRPRLANVTTRFKQLFSYSLRSALINIISQFSDRIDQLIIIPVFGPRDFGLYIVALNASRLLLVVQNSILSVLFPKVANKSVSDVTQITGRAVRVGLILSTSIACCLMISAVPVLSLYAGEQFLSVVPVFRVLTLEIVIKGATLVLAQTFMAVGRPGIVSLLQVIGLGLSIPLMFALQPHYGLLGIGFALLISTSVRFCFILACYPLVLNIRPPGLIPSLGDLAYLKTAINRRRSNKQNNAD